jgi:hypothetical protein
VCNDALEPNDRAAAARVVTTGRQTALATCRGDDDWFALDLAAGGRLTATVSVAEPRRAP